MAAPMLICFTSSHCLQLVVVPSSWFSSVVFQQLEAVTSHFWVAVAHLMFQKFSCMTINRILGKSRQNIVFYGLFLLWIDACCVPPQCVLMRILCLYIFVAFGGGGRAQGLRCIMGEEVNLRRNSCPDDGYNVWLGEQRMRRERGTCWSAF